MLTKPIDCSIFNPSESSAKNFKMYGTDKNAVTPVHAAIAPRIFAVVIGYVEENKYNGAPAFIARKRSALPP